jgi:radical SAM superfamily enzyme YgiQ (UPF0313 family)
VIESPEGAPSALYSAPYARPSPRRRVYLAQYNQMYDNDVFLPMSVAMLAAHARRNPDFDASYEIVDLAFERRDPETIVAEYEDPYLLGFSLYVWNAQLSLRVAELAKKRFPNVLIVLGGPSVPNDSEAFLREHPYVDVLVHGEGEYTFLELCLAKLRDVDLAEVAGLSFLRDGQYVKSESRQRVRALDEIASPFLEGTFDPVLAKPYHFHVIWETNRGCPFQCAFCYWGSNLKAKLAKYDIGRLQLEMDWFVEKKIDFIYAADANFGIDRRDLEIAQGLVDRKRRFGSPKTFFINYLKNSNERVFEIARLLHTEGLCKGATLSLQSLDVDVLANVKRENIKMSVFKQLQQQYRRAGIPSYTELILGLAGETLESFKRGIEETIDAGEHDQIFIYLCRLLPNTEMSSPEHVEQFGIQARSVPILPNHAALVDADPVKEIEEIVVATASMPLADWREANKVSWFVQTFFCMKLAYYVCLFLKAQHGRDVTHFAQFFLDHLNNAPVGSLPLLKRELRRVVDYCQSLLDADPRVDMDDIKDVFPIRWPLEEATFLKLASNRDAFYGELRQVVGAYLRAVGISADERLLDQVFRYQRARIVHFDGPAESELDLDWNLPEFFDAAMRVEPVPLEQARVRMRVHQHVTFASKDEFARFQVWYGRRGKPFYYPCDWERADGAAGRAATEGEPAGVPV